MIYRIVLDSFFLLQYYVLDNIDQYL